MKSLVNYINENLNYDADNYADDLIKKYQNKFVELDDFIKDANDNFYWEYDKVESNDNKLCFLGNFTNNADDEDSYLTINVEKHGNKYKILSYNVE